LRENGTPHATILDPAPASAFTPVLIQPVTIRWAGEDPEGHLREFRYRVFGRTNPDFPDVEDFIAFLSENPEAVLEFYSASDFEGWERLSARKNSTPSVTFETLAPKEVYAFVVVAIDQRGAHDPVLSRESNTLVFGLNPPVPGITFSSSFGEVFLPDGGSLSANIVALASEPTIHWRAVPPEGETIVGYRWFRQGSLPTGEPSLENTEATIDPSVSGPDVLLYVEVTWGSGLHTLYLVHVTFV
jgi:hypothetical protein